MTTMENIMETEKHLESNFLSYKKTDDLCDKKRRLNCIITTANALIREIDEFKNSPEGKAQQKAKLQKTIELLQKKVDSM